MLCSQPWALLETGLSSPAVDAGAELRGGHCKGGGFSLQTHISDSMMGFDSAVAETRCSKEEI